MIEHIVRACDVCERGGLVGMLRHVIFEDGRLQAFNGVLQYQAPSGLAADERFAVSEERLVIALRSCGEEVEVSSTKEFLRLKSGPFTVRVRKIDIEQAARLERITLPKSAAKQKAGTLREALRKVQPFMSTDASRPWSVAVLIKDGYAWATNNLALVRVPVDLPVEMKIPLPGVNFLCELPSLEYYDVDDRNRLVFSCGKALVRVPQASADWPDVAKFFAKMPKKLPEIPAEMQTAARTVGKLAERFVSLTPSQIESRETAMETEYEVDFSKGAGRYNAKLLALILEHATHADFSFYPEPIFFKGESLEGTAVGMKT